MQDQQQRNSQLQSQDFRIKLKEKSHKKEIILVVILLFLIGVLSITIFFRGNILTFLSS